MPYLGECGEQRVAEHGLIQPWVRRIRRGTSIDCGGRAVPRGRSAHSRCNGHDRPRPNIPFKPPAFALARLGARNCQGWRAAELFIGCSRRNNSAAEKAAAPGADSCRSAYEHRPAPFELGRREPDQTPVAESGRSLMKSLGATV